MVVKLGLSKKSLRVAKWGLNTVVRYRVDLVAFATPFDEKRITFLLKGIVRATPVDW